VDPTLEFCRRNFKFLVPLPAVNQVQTLCKILEGILPKVGVRRAKGSVAQRALVMCVRTRACV